MGALSAADHLSGAQFPLETHDYEGRVGDPTHITRIQRGFLPMSAVANMHGARGPEQTEFVCHSFLRNGQWQFLGDCTHALANQTVAMLPLPDWVVGDARS